MSIEPSAEFLTFDYTSVDTLWFDHNCHVRYVEPCEHCGALVRLVLGRDWRRDWFMLSAVRAHCGAECEDCESWWLRHTPDQCRAVRRGDGPAHYSPGSMTGPNRP